MRRPGGAVQGPSSSRNVPWPASFRVETLWGARADTVAAPGASKMFRRIRTPTFYRGAGLSILKLSHERVCLVRRVVGVEAP
jgi:hypothetical protein